MPVRIGLVGLGMMGRVHLASYRDVEGAEVAAVCDIDPARLRGGWPGPAGNLEAGAAGRVDLSGLRATADFDALLAADDLDTVDLCVPTFLHAEMACRALAAGKHVICEKPMALTASEAARMLQAAEAAGRLLLVGHCLRFWPEYVLIREWIASGRYGPVAAAGLTRLGPAPDWAWDDWLADPERSGSAALDLHVHDSDVVAWWFGPAREVASQGVFDDRGGLRHIETEYRFEGGPTVRATGSWNFPPDFPFRMTAQVVWPEASAVYSSLAEPTLTIYEGTRPTHPPVPEGHAYTEELRHFVACIGAGRPSDRAPTRAAARAVRCVEAEIESARTGRPVAV